MNDGNWRKASKCLNEDPELFFPISETSVTGLAQVDEAKRICRSCPVLSECRTEILAREGGKNPKSRHGIVAGMNGNERYRANRNQARRAAAAA